MPYADPLSEPELADALGALPEWRRDGAVIRRVVRASDFRAAVRLVNAVADAAEAADHHPDIAITRYRNVAFELTTHAAKALTQRDIDLATTIEHIVSSTIPASGDEGEPPVRIGPA